MTNVNLDLNKMGLAPLTGLEMQSVDGGLKLVQQVVGGIVDIGSDLTGSTNKTENGIVGGSVVLIVAGLLLSLF